MKGCRCIDVVKVDGDCYLCLKRRANLIGYGGDGNLTEEQLSFIGAFEGTADQQESAPLQQRADQELLRGVDRSPVQPWEIKTPQSAGYGDFR